MTKRLQNINVMRASDLKTFRTFAAKLRHNMHDVLKLYFGLRAKCLWRMIKELWMNFNRTNKWILQHLISKNPLYKGFRLLFTADYQPFNGNFTSPGL